MPADWPYWLKGSGANTIVSAQSLPHQPSSSTPVALAGTNDTSCLNQGNEPTAPYPHFPFSIRIRQHWTQRGTAVAGKAPGGEVAKRSKMISQSSGSKTDAEALEIGWKHLHGLHRSQHQYPTNHTKLLKSIPTHKHDIGIINKCHYTKRALSTEIDIQLKSY